jgi:hypothetical protein
MFEIHLNLILKYVVVLFLSSLTQLIAQFCNNPRNCLLPSGYQIILLLFSITFQIICYWNSAIKQSNKQSIIEEIIRKLNDKQIRPMPYLTADGMIGTVLFTGDKSWYMVLVVEIQFTGRVTPQRITNNWMLSKNGGCFHNYVNARNLVCDMHIVWLTCSISIVIFPHNISRPRNK